MIRTLTAHLPWLSQNLFESLGYSSDSSRKQIPKDILGKCSFFIIKKDEVWFNNMSTHECHLHLYHENVCYVYSSELPSNSEYTQHAIIFFRKKKTFQNYPPGTMINFQQLELPMSRMDFHGPN